MAGLLGALAFSAELVGAIPLGMLSDAVAPRRLMTAGALLGAAATQLFGMTGRPAVFAVSRVLEGLGAAAGAPVIDFQQDASRYFDWHHSSEDTLDKIDRAQLNQNVAGWAAFLYIVSQSEVSFRPAPSPGR